MYAIRSYYVHSCGAFAAREGDWKAFFPLLREARGAQQDERRRAQRERAASLARERAGAHDRDVDHARVLHQRAQYVDHLQRA